MSEKPCFLYAIATLRDGQLCAPVKIGISSQPKLRLNQIQTGSPFQLGFAMLLMLDDRSMAREAEQAALAYFCDRSLSGEWVDVPPLEVIGELMGQLIVNMGFKISLPHDHGARAQ